MRTFTIIIPEDPSCDIRLEVEDLQEEGSKQIKRLQIASETVIANFMRTAIAHRINIKNTLIPKPKEITNARTE